MMRVDVKPNLILWACERARRSIDSLAQQQSFRKLSAWVSGDASPTLRQLEHFAKATHTPLGYFFLPQPPKESVPIPDLRTIGNEHIGYPSPDLLDTMYICQQRQEWYQDFARSMWEIPLPFVGSVTLQSDVVEVSRSISKSLGFDVEERRGMPTWTEALRRFISQADSVGIMVMVSGIVGSNTHRSLDPQEFRGFALADPLAPLVFINGKDTKAAQMFTLSHELAHIWLGETALSDVGPVTIPSNKVEVWCNQVAAELLVPLVILHDIYRGDVPLREELDHLARWFKVSTLVILKRLHDAGKLSREELWRAYEQELKRLRSFSRESGGNFYLTLPARVSKRFARALVISTLEGQTLHRDAFRLLGFSKLATFHKLGHQLGVLVPRSLRAKGMEMFGIARHKRSGVELRVSSLERTLVDVLDRPELTGSWEEIWRSLESVEFFNIDEVIEYVLLLENATTAAKVGFFLEQHKETLMVDDVHLKPLRKLCPQRPHYLIRGKRQGGRLVKEWNLMVPDEILNQSWGEVL